MFYNFEIRGCGLRVCHRRILLWLQNQLEILTQRAKQLKWYLFQSTLQCQDHHSMKTIHPRSLIL